MKETKLFYTPVWRDNLKEMHKQWGEFREHMLERIYALKDEDKGVEKTNFGGWQSDDDLYQFREFGWLIANVMRLGNEIAPEITSRKFDNGLLWANVNGKGDFNAVHTHPDAVLSGVIYLKFDKEEQGIIQFFDAREGSPTASWNCYRDIDDENPFIEDVHSIVPSEGEILFFPGWLKHWVTPNQTDEDRVSISFNIRLAEKKSQPPSVEIIAPK